MTAVPTYRPPYKTFGSRRSLRLLHHDYSEARAYHVTWGTRKGARILHGELGGSVALCLEEEADRSSIEVVAYCVMPDHVHALLIPRPEGNVIRFVQAVKSRTSRGYSALTGGQRLWQRGFYDHIIRHSEDVAQVAAYIVGNPARAGLAEDPAAFQRARVFPQREAW